jgi:hypothetical protein
MANTVINDTDKTVYLKVGDEEAIALEPGAMFTGDIDGVWQPERPNEVYKIGDYVDATVRPTGIDPFGPDVILEAGGYFGWQDQNFIDTKPGWKPFVTAAKSKHAKKQSPSGSGNGKLIEKPTLEDRMMITPDQVEFIITTLLEIKSQTVANTLLIETMQEKLGIKICDKN